MRTFEESCACFMGNTYAFSACLILFCRVLFQPCCLCHLLACVYTRCWSAILGLTLICKSRSKKCYINRRRAVLHIVWESFTLVLCKPTFLDSNIQFKCPKALTSSVLSASVFFCSQSIFAWCTIWNLAGFYKIISLGVPTRLVVPNSHQKINKHTYETCYCLHQPSHHIVLSIYINMLTDTTWSACHPPVMQGTRW